jgi:hypothetical protein
MYMGREPESHSHLPMQDEAAMKRATRLPAPFLAAVVAATVAWGCAGSAAAPPPPSTPTVNSVTISGTTSFTAVGQTSQLTATANLSNGTTQTVTSQATWASSNTAVATVSASGLVTSTGFGQVEIRAAYQGVTGTAQVGLLLNLSGTWAGNASDASGPGRFTWQLSHSGSSVTGTSTVTDTRSGVTGTGTVSGTVSGSQLTFTMVIPQGGFSAPYSSCSATVNGTATASNSTITGTYSGTNSCSGAVGGGLMSLSKQ